MGDKELYQQKMQAQLDELRAKLRRRPVHSRNVALDVVLAEHLASNLIALDLPTSVAKSKLLRALQARERALRSADAAAAA